MSKSNANPRVNGDCRHGNPYREHCQWCEESTETDDDHDNEATTLRTRITKLESDLAEAVSAVADYCDREEEIAELEGERFSPDDSETDVPKMFGLREATIEDVFPGATVWLFGDYNRLYKKHVDQMLHPGDPYKAFCAEDGCRYGMFDLYVLDESKTPKGDDDGK